MKRNRTHVLCAWHLLGAAVVFLCSVADSSGSDFAIIETGTEGNTQVGIWMSHLRGRSCLPWSCIGDPRVVSPSGDVFTPDSVIENGYFHDKFLAFDSYDDALAYAHGTWEVTYPVREYPVQDPPTTETYWFTIDTSLFESFDRTPPTLVSPLPGATIRNGSTFLFGWDYLGTDTPANRTYIERVPQFDPVSGKGYSVVGIPSPSGTSHSSGGTGVGDEKFTHERTNVPGTDKYRFLATYEAAEAALPLDVELTLGSYFAFDDAVIVSSKPGQAPSGDRYFYSRQNDPFCITLSTVPEPTSLGLATLCLLCGTLTRPRSTYR